MTQSSPESTIKEVLDVVKLIYKDTQTLKSDVAILKSDVKTLDIRTLKLEHGQERLEKQHSELTEGQVEIKNSVVELKAKVTIVQNSLVAANERISDMKYFVAKDSEKLDKVYDERKEVIHSFGMQWAVASVLIAIASVGTAKAFFF